MYKRVFFDANILVDIIDPERLNHKYSISLFYYLIDLKAELFTSCDIVTTIYYLASKKDKDLALEKIIYFNKLFKIIEFSNTELSSSCALMKNNDYKDLEDTIQYVLAKKSNCDLIVSNDKNFVSTDILILSSQEFCKRFSL